MYKLVLLTAVVATMGCAQEQVGYAYLQGQRAAIELAGRYARGSKEWDERNQEWLDSEDDEPYPEELEDVDGCGYQDSCDAAEGRCSC